MQLLFVELTTKTGIPSPATSISSEWGLEAKQMRDCERGGGWLHAETPLLSTPRLLRDTESYSFDTSQP